MENMQSDIERRKQILLQRRKERELNGTTLIPSGIPYSEDNEIPAEVLSKIRLILPVDKLKSL